MDLIKTLLYLSKEQYYTGQQHGLSLTLLWRVSTPGPGRDQEGLSFLPAGCSFDTELQRVGSAPHPSAPVEVFPFLFQQEL